MDTSEIERRIERLTPQQRALFLKEIRTRIAADTESAPANADPYIVPTPAQSAMWMQMQLDERSTSYNVSVLYRASPALRAEPLEQAIAYVIARHDALRMRFAIRDTLPHLIVGANEQPLLSLSHFFAGATEADVLSEMSRIARTPFGLATGPLARFVLVPLGTEVNYLLFSLHHSICDGGSLPILVRDIGVAYRAAASGMPLERPPVAQFSDYVRGQGALLKSTAFENKLLYWRAQLEGASVTELPPLVSRPAVQTHSGARARLACGEDWARDLERLANARKTTVFSVLLAGLATLVGRYADQSDLTIGAPFEARGDARFEHAVGNFVNPLPLRIRIAPSMTFLQAVDVCHQTILGALANQDVPFDTILSTVRPPRDASRSPLFQIFLNRFSVPESIAEFQELCPISFGDDRIESKFDLTLYSSSNGGLTAIYNRDLYDPSFIDLFLEQYAELLREATRNPELDIASYLQPAPPVPVARPAVASVGDAVCTVGRRFVDVCERYADRPALVENGEPVTYARLRRYALRVARLLRDIAGSSPRAVAICADSGLGSVASQLAVLIAGHYFVPLDPSNPTARLARIVETTSPAVLVSSAKYASTVDVLASSRGIPMLLAGETGDEPGDRALADDAFELLERPDGLAYVLFTSGTTGSPKGVLQSNANLLAHMEAYADSIGITQNDRLSQFAWFGFDAAIMDVFASLLRGACIVPLDIKRLGLRALRQSIADEGISILHPTPTLFRYIAGERDGSHPFQRVRAVVLGGEEALRTDFELFRHHFPPGAVFVNGYGPSESTTAMQHHLHASSEIRTRRLPVGKPVKGVDITLRTAHGTRPGLLQVGEILITSDRVALGYLNADAETTGGFAAAADDSGRRTYRTGDLGRFVADDVIEFVGRRDGQVKIRGNRVEFGEIRSVMASLEGVSAAAVVARKTDTGETRLAAFYSASASLDESRVSGFLRERLPAYLIPQQIVRLDEIPLRPNGKLDESRLPAAPVEERAVPGLRAKEGLEAAVERIWAHVLGIEHVPADVNFFDLGGHSLMLVEVHARLQQDGYAVALIDMFQYPTVCAISDFIRRGSNA